MTQFNLDLYIIILVAFSTPLLFVVYRGIQTDKYRKKIYKKWGIMPKLFI